MSLESHILAACLMECTAPKPGNVSPDFAFEDLCYEDFQKSAPITARWIGRSLQLGVGPAVETAAAEIRESVGRNTHLGILLLLAPLAAIKRRDQLPVVLNGLTVGDAAHVYNAIRLMEPGGLGDVDDQDVSTVPTVKLLECMQLAADRDTIARQYANGFADVFGFVDELDAAEFEESWKNAVVRLQMKILAAIPDTLIARKCGTDVAAEASRQAAEVLAADCNPEAVAAFGRWLRADGHRRNPGTTADLVAAVLFVALREGRLEVPAELAIVARG